VVNGTEPSSSEAGGSSSDSRPQSVPDRSTSSPAEAISDETVVTGVIGEPAAWNEGAFGHLAPVTPSVDQPTEAAAQATTSSGTDKDFDGAEVRIVEIPCSLGRPSSAVISEFKRAVRALIDLAHPGVLPFLSVSPSPKQITVVMHAPSGVSLESQLTNAMQPWMGVCELVLPVAETLAALHAVGLAHGGLRPDRIFLSSQGGPVLADASVALVEPAALSGVPDAAEVCVSPEQWGGQRSPLTPAMDVYSLGVLLYRLLCGRYPFRTKSRMELMGQVLEDPPQPPRQLSRNIPRRLEEYCLQCLAKRPQERPKDCAAVASDLRDLMMNDDDDSFDSVSGSISGTFRRAAPSAAAGPERFMLIEVTDANGDATSPSLRSAVSATLEARAARSIDVPMQAWMFQLPDLMHAADWLIWFANSAVNVLKLIGSERERSGETDGACWNVHICSLCRDPPKADSEPGEFRERVFRVDAKFTADGVTITPENLRFLQRGLTRHCIPAQSGNCVLVGDDGAELSVHIASPTEPPPLTGRNAFSAMLRSRWEQACAGMGQIVLVIGDEGVGKSRLICDLNDSLSESPTDYVVLHCECRPSQRGRALHPMLEWLAGVLGQQGQQSNEERRQTLANLIDDQEISDPSAGQLLEVELGLAEPDAELQSLTESQRMDRLRQILLDWLRSLALKTPVLFVVEDLQWVDAATLRFLEQLVELGFNNRILTILSFRSDFETPWGSRAHQTQIALNRLTKKHVAALVGSITGVEPDSTSLSEIRSLTGSIPLFIEHHAKYTLAR